MKKELTAEKKAEIVDMLLKDSFTIEEVAEHFYLTVKEVKRISSEVLSVNNRFV